MIALLGGCVASFGFFLLPVIEIKPNRLASGLPVSLLEIPGDMRYLLLFLLSLTPVLLAFLGDRNRRGWALAAVGNLMVILSLYLPALAGDAYLLRAEALFEAGTRISNPRVLTSAGIAAGLAGGYITLFAGLLDLQSSGASRLVRGLVGAVGALVVVVMLGGGTLDVYSIMVEYHSRGETLALRFLEHIVFVAVALAAGLIVGIALGLWASRDAKAEDAILYTVGIIQTIPSLALFGILLVPLARLGDAAFLSLARDWLLLAVLALAAALVLRRVHARLPERTRQAAIVAVFILALIPMALVAVLIIAFGFEVALTVLTMAELALLRGLTGLALFSFLILMSAGKRFDLARKLPQYQRLRFLPLLLAALGGLTLLAQGAGDLLGKHELGALTIRDFGVSGIGTAPAIIALTLYSLLPLVRNTYAGLKNIDPAIIDSGKGMGFTAAQSFFRIELPLAFPVLMAGVRNAAISLVGIAAVASIIGAGALGDFILLGVNSTSIDQILLGAIPAVLLAAILDGGLKVLEGLLTSPGIRQA